MADSEYTNWRNEVGNELEAAGIPLPDEARMEDMFEDGVEPQEAVSVVQRYNHSANERPTRNPKDVTAPGLGAS